MDVLVLGDVILDHYLIGRVERISPEAPVPVVIHEREEHRLGGAANVALNLQALGANPHLVSVVGNDSNGSLFNTLMEQHQINASGILADQTRPTTIKTRVLARNQQLFRYDRELTSPLNDDMVEALKLAITQKLDTVDIKVIIFQDYNKGILSPEIIDHTIQEAQKRNIPTVADPKKANFLAYKGITLFKPNLKEINEGLGLQIQEQNLDLGALSKAAKYIQDQLQCTHVLITLGAKGLFLGSPNNYQHFPTKERQVADVCGAGDTVISVVALGVASNISIQNSAILANIAGGQVCEKIGVVPINKSQLLVESAQLLDN
ncbi:MAG: carbohydrate kinase [Aureispira sp.]|nr:carbohydrate kinase [Aureispira sp.]